MTPSGVGGGGGSFDAVAVAVAASGGAGVDRLPQATTASVTASVTTTSESFIARTTSRGADSLDLAVR